MRAKSDVNVGCPNESKRRGTFLKCLGIKKSTLFRAIWFENREERDWFSDQFVTYYTSYQKSIVLYAIKRLAFLFKMPFDSFDGKKELITLFDLYKKSNNRHWLSFPLPTELHRNPLQTILDDYSCAEDDFKNAKSVSSIGALNLTPFCEHSTVSDYVRFIVEYDTWAQQTDNLRIPSFLGLTQL